MTNFAILPLQLLLPVIAAALQPKATDLLFRCGQRPANSIGVITAGQSTWPGQFPWHAALYRRQLLGSEYICGGFLVSDRVVVTAAHCVTAPNGYQMVPEALLVRLGVHELLAMSRDGQEHRVERVYRHEEYEGSSYRHDVAVLMLQTVVEFTRFVQPVCLWNVGEFGTGLDLVGTVSGWGLTEYDVLANSLKSARLPMVSYLDCLEKDRDVFAPVLFDGMFCAGLDNGTNVCNGDSGGAFVVNINGTWIARGIISFTGLRESTVTLCNPKSYAGFVNLPRYVEWIEKVANANRFVPIESSTDNGNVTKNDYPSSESFSATQSINTKKCAQYRNGSGGTGQDLSYLAFVARETPFMRVIDCFAVLISEHFLISTADCRLASQACPEQFVIIETEGRTLRYGIRNFHQHPKFIASPTENNLALIELERNVSIPSQQLVCLHDRSLWSREELDLAKIILYSAVDVAKQPTPPSPLMESVNCFDQLLAPSIMVPADGFLHLAGLVVNSTCARIRFIKLYKFIPWIEGIVWKDDD
ncbi:ovochymase-2 [Culex quinquefasciatus]|uniref:ovochymase-2 n=1 Tax=Culex quinquefasciatus TaxID=7176 RepID=UPI0018E29A32|nr:ovochymase-2 [Culex quinquefasciatus]